MIRLLAIIFLVIPASPDALGFQQRREPFFKSRETPIQYHGPGRDEEAPADLAEVRIGYFGHRQNHSSGGTE